MFLSHRTNRHKTVSVTKPEPNQTTATVFLSPLNTKDKQRDLYTIIFCELVNKQKHCEVLGSLAFIRSCWQFKEWVWLSSKSSKEILFTTSWIKLFSVWRGPCPSAWSLIHMSSVINTSDGTEVSAGICKWLPWLPPTWTLAYAHKHSKINLFKEEHMLDS